MLVRKGQAVNIHTHPQTEKEKKKERDGQITLTENHAAYLAGHDRSPGLRDYSLGTLHFMTAIRDVHSRVEGREEAEDGRRTRKKKKKKEAMPL